MRADFRCVMAFVLLSPFPIASAQAVSDSAGIRLVSYPRDARPLAVWQVPSAPILSFGGVDGAGPAEFSRVVAARRLPDGRVLVANQGTNEIRFFDANGRFLRASGRTGSGPGEFSQLWGFVVRGDTVQGYDSSLGSHVFTLRGDFVRQVRMPSLRPYLVGDPYGVLSSGELVQGGEPRRTRLTGPGPEGYFADTSALFVIDPAGSSAKMVARMAGFEMFREPGTPGPRPVAFGGRARVAVFPQRICVGHSRIYEVRCHAPDGRLEMVLRRDVQPRVVSDSARAAFVAGERERPGEGATGSHSARMEQFLRSQPFAERYPVFSAFMAAQTGELWIADYLPADGIRGGALDMPPRSVRTWNVYSAAGEWTAAIGLPVRFTVTDAGQDFLLGVLRDIDGVETVALFRLNR